MKNHEFLRFKNKIKKEQKERVTSIKILKITRKPHI